ncbi:MAG TPA: cation:proton antiporter, partial [Ruminococcaceae bacterium]|nr:cation:proton antiporter [Oscillospiraceae bacterium]
MNSLGIIAIILTIILVIPMICRKIRIPSIVGFIVAGIIVGPYGFEILGNGTSIQALGKIGMLYIML